MVREMMGGTYYSSTTSSSGGGCGGDGGDMMNIGKPAWLERLMAETFFGDCGVHRNRRKNEKNIFCLHCCLSICPHCFPSHRSHPLLQVLYQFQILVEVHGSLWSCMGWDVLFCVYKRKTIPSIDSIQFSLGFGFIYITFFLYISIMLDKIIGF